MKHLLAFICLSLFCSMNLLSQELEIVSALKYEESILMYSAPTDYNNGLCSKIVVDVPLEDMHLEGNYNDSQYYLRYSRAEGARLDYVAHRDQSKFSIREVR